MSKVIFEARTFRSNSSSDGANLMKVISSIVNPRKKEARSRCINMNVSTDHDVIQ